MKNLMSKMKTNKDVSMKKNMNKQLWSEPMLRIAVKKGQLSKKEYMELTKKEY